MEDCIICQINLFAIEQEIQLIHNTSCYKIPIEDINNLPSIIAEYCHAQNVNKIHLFGNQDYLQGLANNISLKAANNYKISNLEIKFNE